MRPARLLYFAKDGSDVLPPHRFRERYGLEPDGVNFYYGLNPAAGDRFKKGGPTLSDQHRRFFDMLVRAALASPRPGFTLNLGLWPFEAADPYGTVERNLPVVRKLAEELRACQDSARHHGKRLEVVVRYASEMNDPHKPSQPWGRPHQPWNAAFAAPYRRTLPLVRGIFREAAPAIRFAFSPALRADITGQRYEMIREFWPGDEWIDIVSCTWYVGQAAHVETAAAVLSRYVREFAPKGKPFGIDELGGADGPRGNDAVLQRMFTALSDMRVGERAVRWDYATLFLHGGRWNADATLAFLR
jgi:hypothetical protein